LSRNISTLEKIIILIVITGIVLGAGGYFIVYPAYEGIGAAENKIEEKERQIESAQELRRRDIQLNVTYRESRERAGEVHEGFFDEMTATEAITMVQEILNGANNGNGYTAHAGINVTDISQASLRLSLWTGGRNIRYSLRDLAFGIVSEAELIRAAEEEARELIAADEEWDPPRRAAEFIAARDLENATEEDITAIMEEHSESLALFLRALTDMLKTSAPHEISIEHRLRYLDLLRTELDFASDPEIGQITATFSLEMTYAQYLEFLDYLHNYPLRLSIGTCTLYQDIASQAEAFGDLDETAAGLNVYSFVLSLLVVRPMEIPDSGFITEEGEEDDDEEEEETGEQEEV
jgi:hypothetical protein